MVPAPIHHRRLSRAAWALGVATDGSNLPPLKEGQRHLDAEGVRLVTQVATSWTSRFQFNIAQLGFDESAFHYECIFSCPVNHMPVPTFVLKTKFALVLAGEGKDPRLLYSFEEGDLRHEWKLERDENDQWMASLGDQKKSLGYGSFEKYLDRVVREKEKVRSRGVDVATQFEATRLQKPPAYSEEDSEGDSDVCESARVRMGESTGVPDINVIAPVGMDQSEQEDMGLAMLTALKAAGLYCEKVEPPSSLAALLANIFDAADEENAGELPHYEVARLLSGTLPGFGLELWDIYLLMTSAQENDDGFIECKPFIQAAPEIVQALRKRRIAYKSRGLPGVEIPVESVKHCFAEEVHVTATMLTKLLEQCTVEDASCGKWVPGALLTAKERTGSRSAAASPVHSPATRGSVAAGEPALPVFNLDRQESCGGEQQHLESIKRRFCQDCLSMLPERLSPQEAMRLLQMLPEDEDGFIMVDELEEHLEHLRTEAMLNALVESDVLSLRTHLVLRFRHLGLAEDGKMSLWIIKQALLQADQVCLTRLQIHCLLCQAESDVFGNVDIAKFLGMCCVIIPHMFDARLFAVTAEHLIQEHADNMRRAENEEMAALGAASKVKVDKEEEAEVKVDVDSDTVEKMLLQLIALNDDIHRTPPALPAQTIYNILQSNEREVQGTQLSSFELTGLLAEMDESDGVVAYVEHIKKWVPIIFEQRKNRLLGRYLEDDANEKLGYERPDLEKLEGMFPLLPMSTGVEKKTKGSRRSSRLRETKDNFADSRRNSISSNPPSYRRSTVSNENVSNSKGGRSGGGSLRGSRNLSTQLMKENIQPKQAKEPPAGRGYLRRKALLAAAAADVLANPSPLSPDSKVKA